MRRSVVSSSSKPASSATFNSAPLVSASHPSDCAVRTVCPGSALIRPLGVPWSNRTSTGGDFRAQAICHELENGRDLFARHIELLDYLVDAEVLEVLDDRVYRQTRALEHPGATHLAGDALDSRTLGPVKGGHLLETPDFRLRQKAPIPGQARGR